MMQIRVKVFPNAKKDEVLMEGKGDLLKVRVKAPALKGRANKALIEVLAAHLGVKKSDIRIVSGERSREKIVEVNAEGGE